MDMRNSVIYSASAEKIYGDAIKTFGREKQLLVCAEECAELSKEILKLLRYRLYNAGDPTVYNLIAEEVADVLITTAQVVMMLQIRDEVERIADEKLRRLQVVTERETAFRENRVSRL